MSPDRCFLGQPAVKVFASLLAISLIFLGACTPKQSPTTTATTTTSTSTTPPATTATQTTTTTTTTTPTTTTTTTTTTASPNPDITITSPVNVSSVMPGSISVNIIVTNFSLVAGQGQANVPGQGHVIYYLDTSIPTSPNQPAYDFGGKYATAATTSYTWPDVPVGKHTFGAQLVNNDDTPLSPPVFASVQVTVEIPPHTTGTLQLSAVSNVLETGIDRILVTIDTVEVHEPGDPWVTLLSGPTVLDLASMQRIEKVLVSKEFLPGTFTQVRFNIKSVEVVVGTQHYQTVSASDSVTLTGAVDVVVDQTAWVVIGFDAFNSVSQVTANIYAFDPVVHLLAPRAEGPQIVTPGLPNGSPDFLYSENLISVGGIPADFSITSGSLPTGVALDHKTGTVKGTPTEPGLSAFTITMTDSSSRTTSRDYVIRIAIKGLPIVATSFLPSAEKNEPYSFALTPLGGTGPYTWSWASSSPSLPPGLILDSQTGNISGIPTTAGDYAITVILSDSAHPLIKDEQILRLHVEQ